MEFACPSDKNSGLSFVRDIFSSHFHETLNSQLKIPQQSILLSLLHHTRSDSSFQIDWVALLTSHIIG
jgi:hypothetical protein